MRSPLRQFGIFARTYRGKLLLAILVAGWSAGIFDIYNESTIASRYVANREIVRVDILGRILADDITDDLLAHDTSDLRDVMGLALQTTQVLSLMITDTQQNIIISTSGRIGKIVERNMLAEELATSKAETVIRSYPLRKEQYPDRPELGYLHIEFSLHDLHAEVRAVQLHELRNDAIMLLAILLMAWVTSGILVQPLTEMRDVAIHVAGGDFSRRSTVRSPDIIGQLARTINSMAAQLGDLHENLQRKIQDKTQQLENSNRKLQELDRLKSELVSMVSHELRTPLTSIIGYSHTLQNLTLPREKQIECLKIIEEEGRRLAGMVQESLDITLIESGDFHLNMETVDLRALAQRCRDLVAIENRDQIKIREINTIQPVWGDYHRIQRVLLNLLANALKYSAGSQEIFVELEKQDGVMEVRVVDHGLGVAPEFRDSLFEKFQRGSDEIAQRTRGSGLGLYIAKTIVNAHGGSIECRETMGGGATFAFTILLPIKDRG